MNELEPRFVSRSRRTREIPIIRIFHDESTFYSNADQSFHWADDKLQALKQKSLGQAIMVSDFIEEHGAYLEHQSEGYWKNEHMLKQTKKAIKIFERKYPNCIALFLFDTHLHTKRCLKTH